MIKASDLRRGDAVSLNGNYYVVRDIERSAPTARGGNTTFRLQLFSIPSQQKLDLSLRADDELETIELNRRPATFSYMDGETYVFMDSEDFTQYYLSPDLLANQVGYIVEGVEGYFVSVVDGLPVGLQPPQMIALTVMETAPELKGASATSRTKPATLSTGITIQVPEYIENGTPILVNTETGEYGGRA